MIGSGWASWAIGAVLLVVLAKVASIIMDKMKLSRLIRNVANYKAPINCFLSGKRVLVLVNPYGGDGGAMNICRSTVLPMLTKCRVAYDLVETKSAQHPKQIALETDLTAYAGIIVVSGDGMLHEIVNGLAQRFTHEGQTDIQSLAQFYSKIAIGLIPAGSSNGVATTLGRFSTLQQPVRDPFLGMRVILEGTPKPYDLMSVRRITEEKGLQQDNPIFDCMMASTCVVSDVDKLAEQDLRFLNKGFRKFAVPIYTILRKRRYPQEVSILPVPAQEIDVKSQRESNYRDTTRLPDCPGRPGWKQIKDVLLMVTAMKACDGADDLFTAPGARLTDGCMDLMLLRENCSRLDLILHFLTMSDGSHVRRKTMEMYKIKEMIMIPDAKKKSKLDISGSLYEFTPVHVVVHSGVARFLY